MDDFVFLLDIYVEVKVACGLTGRTSATRRSAPTHSRGVQVFVLLISFSDDFHWVVPRRSYIA